MAVLPHPPSCSTNPRGGTAAIFYLSSRRQPTMPPTSQTSAPSCFSLSNHVRSSSGTPTNAVHLLRHVNPSRQLRRRQLHAPTTPLSKPKRRAKFMQVTALHPLPNSTGPYLAVLPHPPSCSTNPHGGIAAILFYYQSSRRQPTLPPTSASSCFHFPSTSGLPQALAIMHHCYTDTNVPVPPHHLFFTFQPRQVFLKHSHYDTLG